MTTEAKRKYMKKYYEKNKETIKQTSKKNKHNHTYKYPYTEKIKIRSRQYVKENNYKYEKTDKQRTIRNVKRQTRRLFPLDNQICEVCNYRKTDEHHHTTIPISRDCFLYVCHNCHINTGKILTMKMEVKKDGK